MKNEKLKVILQIIVIIVIFGIFPLILSVLSVSHRIKQYSGKEECYEKMYAIEEEYKKDFSSILNLKEADVNFSEEAVTVTLTSKKYKLKTTFKDGVYFKTEETQTSTLSIDIICCIFMSILLGIILDFVIAFIVCNIADAIVKILKKKKKQNKNNE